MPSPEYLCCGPPEATGNKQGARDRDGALGPSRACLSQAKPEAKQPAEVAAPNTGPATLTQCPTMDRPSVLIVLVKASLICASNGQTLDPLFSPSLLAPFASHSRGNWAVWRGSQPKSRVVLVVLGPS